MSDTKSDIAELFRASGKTQREFCEEHGIRYGSLMYHLYKKKGRPRGVDNKPPHKSLASIKSPFVSFENNHNQANSISVTILQGTFDLTDLLSIIKSLRGSHV